MINFGVIGTNVITDQFLEAGRTLDEFHLRAVYSRSREKAEQYAEKQGAELVFDNLDELASCGDIDAVYVASPNSLHAAQSIQMMKKGKHILCEKTIASNQSEFQQMKRVAYENQVILMEAMRSVYSPGFEMIRKNLPKLGPVRRISFQYCQYSRRYDNFKKGIIENAFNPALSNGALMDIGVYCVHPMAALFGKPDKIASSSLKLSNGVDGAGTILVEYEGMQAELLYSKISNSKVPSQIQGEEGTMVIWDIPNPQTVTVYYRNGKEETLDIPKTENNMCYEIAEFIKMIKEDRINHPYLHYSEIELEIMDEVRRQQGMVFPADRNSDIEKNELK